MEASELTDDQLVIRHVRLCECGLPADHDSICKPGRLGAARRVDQEWEEQNADRRAERHAGRQPGFRAERSMARSRMTIPELRSLVEIREAKLSPVSAGNIAPSQRGAVHPSANLALQAQSVVLDSDPRWRSAGEFERRSLMRMHELLDEYEGLGVAKGEREISAEEKDAEIVAPHNQHLSNAEFARQFLGYGSPSTISRKRRWFAAGFCTFNGLPPRGSCRCPTCRSAVT